MKEYSLIIGSLILAVGLFLSANSLPQSVGGNVVPGINLYPTTGEQQTITPTTDITLTHADSGKLYLIATGTTATLPAVREGVWFDFVVSGSIADTNFIVDSAEGDNIEGSLIVAGAVVDCAAEDQVNFVNTAENVGDSLHLSSDGTSWFIQSSNALTTGGITCTDPS